MNQPPVTIRIPAAVLALAAILAVALLSGIVVLASGSGGDESSPSTASVAPTPTLAPTAEPTAQPTPDPTAAARGCAEVLASGFYQTPEEKQFYQDNCRTQAATAPAPAPSGPAPAPNTGAPLRTDFQGRIEFIGAVWADESMPAPYCVNPNNGPIRSDGSQMVSADAFVALVRGAIQRWDSIPGARLSFAYQGVCETDPFNNRDGVNTIGWGWLFGSAIGLAHPAGTHGHFLRGGTTGQIFEMDLIIDTRFAQSFDNPAEYLDWRLEHIILHETGHFVGLAHASDPCSIMQPTITFVGELCWVEIAAVQSLYP